MLVKQISCMHYLNVIYILPSPLSIYASLPSPSYENLVVVPASNCNTEKTAKEEITFHFCGESLLGLITLTLLFFIVGR